MFEVLHRSRYTTSPTGRNPRILWTPEYQLTLDQMKADYDANPSAPTTWGGKLYKHYKAISDGTHYFDNGQYGAWLYQAGAGDTYASNSWTRVNATGTASSDQSSGSGTIFTRTGAGLGGNWAREQFLEHVLIYEFTYPWLVANGHQEDFLAALNNVATYLVNTEAIPIQDSDQGTGKYLGLRALYQATKAYNSTIVTLMADAEYGLSAVPSAANYSTFRNALSYWASVAGEGGEWCESSHYNWGTTRFLMVGLSALNVTDDVGDFSDVLDTVPDMAHRFILTATPDREFSFQWGDDETPRQYGGTDEFYRTMSTGMAYAGALSESDPERAWLMKFLDELYTQHGPFGTSGPFVYKAEWNHDPYATVAADLSDVPLYHFAPGMGMGVRHVSPLGTTAGTAYWFHFYPGMRRIDHTELINYWGDFQLYRQGEFALTHPIANSTAQGLQGIAGTMHADGVNCTFVEGFGRLPGQSNNHDVLQYRKVEAHRFGTDYTAITGTTGGMVHPLVDAFEGTSNYFDPPACYCSEWTRTLVVLHTADDTAYSIVVLERINAADPEAGGLAAKFARYRTANPPEQTLIAAAPTWQSFLHQRTEPTVTGLVTTWTTAGGQLCKDDWLLPSSGVTITKQDETALSPYDMTTAEKKWRTHVTPDADAQWNVLLRVVSVRDSGETHTSTALSGTNDSIGVLLTRSGNDDRVVVFNGIESDDALIGTFPTAAQAEAAVEGIHLRQTGFTITWTQTTTNCKVLLCHLDPAAGSWTAALDGGSASGLTITDGVAEYTATGTGSKSLVVAVS